MKHIDERELLARLVAAPEAAAELAAHLEFEPELPDAGALPPPAPAAAPAQRLPSVNAAELLTLERPPREMVLSPWLPRQGLAMVYSKRGVGKTHLALGIAYAVASGGAFLRWQAPEPRRVLYVDGEMPAAVLKARFAAVVTGAAAEMPSPDNLRFLAADLTDNGIPDLTTAAGIAAIEAHLADRFALLILDNLSTLCRSGRENESESWAPVQDWALSLRRRGVSVLFVHHAGKAGAQRGTSKREDVLDSVLALRHPEDYSPADGARFELHLEKARGVWGADAEPFEARLETRDEAALWTMKAVEGVQDAMLREVVELKAKGLSVRKIAAELEISKSRVHQLTQKAADEAAGLSSCPTA